jgi:hypothetical protein
MKNLVILFLATTVMALTSCDSTTVSPDSSDLSNLENASDDGIKISASELPANITIYLSKNYAGKTVIKAEKYVNKYEVTISDLTKIEFTLSGAFIEVSGKKSNGVKVSDDPMVNLPQNIKDYLAKNYPGVTIYKAEKSLNKYEVKLNNGIRVDFNLNGQVIRIKKW